MKKLLDRLCARMVVTGLAVTWIVSPALAVPPDPDNAALLYYQAFLSIADLGKEARDHVAEVARGTAPPTEKTREYIGKCKAGIEFAEAARPLQMCRWGFRYSQGFDALMPHLAQMRFLTYVLLAEARLRASDGDYRGALDRCLMMRTFARHVGDDPLISYLVSIAVTRLGYECMQDVMGQAAGDAELLQRLRTELATSGGPALSPITSLKNERDIAMGVMQMDKIDKFAGLLAAGDEKKQAQIVAAANEETLARARRAYSEAVLSALTVLSTPVSYEQAHQQLTQLETSLDPNDPATAAAKFLMPAVVKLLSLKTRTDAHANAVQAAVEICLQRAKTGRLPEALPAGVPKDPFSGQDFHYERTPKGFVLRCQGKDLDNNAVQEFVFAMK